MDKFLPDDIQNADEADLPREFGAAGQSFFQGFLENLEYNRKLTGQSGAKIYDQMRRADPDVRAILQVQKLPLFGATWYIECEDKAVKADLEMALGLSGADGKIDWMQFLMHLLLVLDFGFEVMEVIYKVEDGKYWFKKLAHRAQTTIYKWNMDEESGELKEIVQLVNKNGSQKEIPIPAWKCLRIALQQEGDNFEGISALRATYKPWYVKDIVEKVDAMAHERWGLGVPFAEPPEDFDPKDKAAAIRTLKNLRTGAQAYVWQPPGWKFGVLGAGEGTRLNPMESLRYHGEQIARSALAMFLTLGTTETGSRALGGTFLDFFYSAETALANGVVGAVNHFLIKPFLILNYANGDKIMASLRWQDLKMANLDGVARALGILGNAGFITPDDDTENLLRDLADLPPKKEDEDGRQQHSTCTHGHRQFASGEFWREPRELEKTVALRELRGRFDDAPEELAALYKKIKTAWLDHLRVEVENALADGDPTDLEDIQLPKTLIHSQVKTGVSILRDTYRYGRQTVRDEMRRQKRMAGMAVPDAVALRDEPIDEEEQAELYEVRLRRYFAKLARRMDTQVTERALDMWRTRGADYTAEEMDEVFDEAFSALDAAALRGARPLVGEAISAGRTDEALSRTEDIEYAESSAILDDNACEACLDDDGFQTQVGSDEYIEKSPPKSRCESTASGENRCRCAWIYKFVTESAARG